MPNRIFRQRALDPTRVMFHDSKLTDTVCLMLIPPLLSTQAKFRSVKENKSYHGNIIGSLPEFSPVIKATLTSARADLGEGGGVVRNLPKNSNLSNSHSKISENRSKTHLANKIIIRITHPRGIFSGSAHAESYKVTIWKFDIKMVLKKPTH